MKGTKDTEPTAGSRIVNPKKQIPRWKKAATLIVTALLLAIILLTVEFSEIWRTLNLLTIPSIIVIIIIFGINYTFRSIRFKTLLDGKGNLGNIWCITVLNDALNNLLPLKSGEFYYIIVTRKIKGVGLKESISSLILTRAFDILIISPAFIIAYLQIGREISISAIVTASIITIGLLTTVVLLTYKNRLIRDICEKLLYFTRLAKIGALRRGSMKLITGLSAFKILKKPKNLLSVTLTSIAVWITAFMFMRYILLGLGIQTTIPEAIFITSGIFLGFVFPLTTVGNIGTFEAVLVFLLAILGWDVQRAINIAVVIHMILFAVSLFYGAAAYIIRSSLKRLTCDD